MSVSANWYGTALLNQWGTTPINWTLDTIKCCLALNLYTPNQDTHVFYSDITNELATGSGYTAGGSTLTTPAKTYTAATNVVMLDADDASWPTSTITARYAIIYKSTGTPTTSPLMGFVNFGQDVSSTAATFTISWDVAGIFTITPA